MTARIGEASSVPAVLRVVQVTDTHLFGDVTRELGGVNTERSCEQVFDLVRREALPADLLLLTGDLVQDGSIQAYRRLRARMESLGLPGLVIPGNHDQIAPMREVFSHGDTAWRGHTVAHGWLVVMLNSSVPGSPAGHVADAELARLDELLADHPDHHALVCLHHHPVAMGSRWIDAIGVDNSEALFSVLDRHPNVRGVVWGHVHQAYQGRRGQVALLATPSTCLQFAPGESEFTVDAEAPGYRTLDLYANGRIDTAVRRLERMPESVNLRLGGY